jgi:hypothetical protein
MRRAAKAGDLLDTLLAGWGIDARLRQYQAITIWAEVVGPQIAARTRPEKIRDGVLEVCVDQPTWMQQLQLLKPQILAKLNARLGDTPLREIFLKRGKVTPPPTANTKPAAPAWRKMALAPEEEQELRTLLARVDDEELRRELGSLLEKQLKLTKTKNQKQLAADQI